MERRELFRRLLGVATTAGIVGRVSLVDAEPRPVLAVIEFGELEDDVVDRTVEMIQRELQETDLANVRVLALGDGMRLTFIDANGRVCNQDLRTLPEGGS